MSVKSSEIIQAIEAIAPRRLAESWDNVGLQIGSNKREVSKVLFTLDVTAEVVAEAIEIGAQMIVAHHPFIFNGLKGICTDELKGRMVADLIKNDICLYVAHTNLDKAELGLSDYIGKRLGLEAMQPLSASDAEKLYKIVVYVPVTHEELIVEVMGSCGAGFIGRYSHCTYRTCGKGTFMPLAGTHPFIGEQDELTTVEESRVETIVDGKILKRLMQKLKQAHPYEEMAYDLYPLENGELMNQNGLGKIGRLNTPVDGQAFIEHIKKTLDLEWIRATGNPPEKISKVALCTGSGAEFIGLAKVKKADVYITGDLKYHDAQRAVESNLWVIDAGHFGTEKLVVDLLASILEDTLRNKGVTWVASSVNRDFIRCY